ncbi:MAG: O-antigen ligase family protein [Candidatus Sulfotelmatobacter sp.]
MQRLFSGPYKWVVLFGLVCVASCVYAPRPVFAVAWAFKLGLVILLLHLCSAYLGDLRDIDSFLRVTLWALAFLLVYWALQGNGTDSFFDDDGRLVGSNGLSATGGTVLMLSLTLYSRIPGWGLRKSAIVLGAVAFVIMVFAGGKAGILTGLISGIIFFVWRRGFGSAVVFLAGALVVGAIVISVSPLSRYFENYVQEDQATTLTGRTPLWEVALPAIWQRPILGHGYVSSTFVSIQVNGVPWSAGHMHNGFLEALYNNGLIGFLLILLIHFVIARNLLRVTRHAPPTTYLYQLGVGCFAVYINLLINGFANASFGGRAWHPFMVLLALVVVSEKLVEILSSRQTDTVPILAAQVA